MGKNIILTTMSTLPWNPATNYYSTKDRQDHTLYCDGIAQTEAGTKLFLSQLRIDHIVVIGSDKTYCANEESGDEIIDSFNTPDLVSEAAMYSQNVREYSYRYYKYRIAQFLQDKNAEQKLLAESIPEDRRKYLENITSEYMQSNGYAEPKEWFHILASSPGSSLSGGLRKKIDSDIRDNFISEDQYEQYLQPVSKYPELIRLETKVNALKRQIKDKTFSLDQLKFALQNRSFTSREVDLDYEARLFILSRRLEENITDLEIEQYIAKSAVYREVMPAKENATASLTFVPDMLSSGNYNISGIINAIRSISEDDKDTVLDLYIDMQGGNRTDGYVKNAVLSIFNNDKHSRIFIRKVVATEFEPRNFASAIVDETNRYRVTDLTAGMNAFIQYGRADLIKNHLRTLGIKKDSHTGKLASAMVEIDHALSICNVTALTRAIDSIREIFNEPASSDSSEAAEIFRVLENGIRQDYGDLISKPEIDYYDLTNWALSKGFIQQAVTIIESKMPIEFVRKGICSFDDSEREKNIRIFRNIYQNETPDKDKNYFDNIDNYFIKRYIYSSAADRYFKNNRQRIKKNLAKPMFLAQKMALLLNASSSDVIKVHSICGPKRMTSVLEKYYQISEFRNDVNHSSEKETAFTYQNIKQAINDFLVTYKNAFNNISWKDFHVRPITLADIKRGK